MHLFIVSEQTLPVHLQYQFVGVTKRNGCSWSNVDIGAAPERAQASLYADICRVHRGDEILFYLERPQRDIGREGGRFLGIFEVTSEFPIYEKHGNYLRDKLGLPLIYRLLIRPKEVFKVGVTEWQLMDEMTDFQSIYDIPWTLIYRKMTGRRGCTPLLPHEAELILRMLDLRNAGQRIYADYVTLDTEKIELVETNDVQEYTEHPNQFDKIDDHLRHLINNTTRKWELQLQAYLMQEIGRNPILTSQLFPEVDIVWIGNEIYAGAGMQSIDILIYTENKFNRFIHLIELKSVNAAIEAAEQLNRYIKWLKAHIPNISVHQIIPTVIAPEIEPEFHRTLCNYLQGHGITQYRTVKVDNNLQFFQDVHSVF